MHSNRFILPQCNSRRERKFEKILLTDRENEILELVSLGQSTDEIARNLFLSQDTIKTHRRSLLLKFSARNMAQMIRLAFEQGVFAENLHMPSEKKINYLIGSH